MTKKHLLITAIGRTDLNALDTSPAAGPIMNALRYRQEINEVHILVDPNPEIAAGADRLKQRLAGERPELAVRTHPVPVDSPMDYEGAYVELRRIALDILRSAGAEVEAWINLSSGFPAWQTVWFLLVHSRQISGRLIHVRKPEDVTRYGHEPIEEVVIRLDEFPRVEAPYGKAFLESELHRRERSEHADLERLQEQALKSGIIFKSRAMADVLRQLQRLASSDFSILLLGETGVGKEGLARFVYDQWCDSMGISGKAEKKPFFAVNCGGIPESMLEAELFGHAKGSFTGASKDRDGLFRQANNGILFLDEIGDASPKTQTSLLRVMQDGKVRPVGGDSEHPVQVRVIAATNRELETGGLRKDLFERFTVSICIPPLRERPEDALLLAEYFLGKYKQPQAPFTPSFTPEAKRFIERNDWPGNVRELENTVKYASHMTDDGRITPDLLAQRTTCRTRPFAGVSIPSDGIDLEEQLDETRDAYIGKALEICDGNKAEASRLLGCNEKYITNRRRLSHKRRQHS